MKEKPSARAKSASRRAANKKAPDRVRGAAGPVTLRRISKGRRPEFHDDPAVDQLFAIVTALAAELSVAFDRISTLEHVLTAAGAVTADCIESYQPSPQAASDRASAREQLIQRVFAVFETYAAPRER